MKYGEGNYQSLNQWVADCLRIFPERKKKRVWQQAIKIRSLVKYYQKHNIKCGWPCVFDNYTFIKEKRDDL